MRKSFPTVTAVRFDKVMGSGRTRPCLLVCEDTEGREVEVVAKLRGGQEMTLGKLLSEAIAALLARDLGLPAPQPYLVEVTADFAKSVPEVRDTMTRSVGWNFGSAKWSPGTTIWPRDRQPSKEMLQTAAEIFAFDALIQNPDRRAGNPNCAFLGSEFVIFDHEAAFSHFLTIFPINPWDARSLSFLHDHVFNTALKGGGLNLNRLQGAFEAITVAQLDSWVAAMPDTWDSEKFTARKICDYLLECRDNFATIHTHLEAFL